MGERERKKSETSKIFLWSVQRKKKQKGFTTESELVSIHQIIINQKLGRNSKSGGEGSESVFRLRPARSLIEILRVGVHIVRSFSRWKNGRIPGKFLVFWLDFPPKQSPLRLGMAAPQLDALTASIRPELDPHSQKLRLFDLQFWGYISPMRFVYK